MDNVRRKQLAWLRAIEEQSGWTQTELARRAGVSPSTLSRFRNDARNAAVLDTDTVSRINAVSPIPHYESVRPGLPDGFAESEAQPFEAGGEALVDDLVATARRQSNNIHPWVLGSRALENLGYLPGDVLVVDMAARPAPGDIVCAQIYDRGGGAETAFRLYQRPYLVAASNRREHLMPTLIDDRVDVRGVVVAAIRPRHGIARP